MTALCRLIKKNPSEWKAFVQKAKELFPENENKALNEELSKDDPNGQAVHERLVAHADDDRFSIHELDELILMPAFKDTLFKRRIERAQLFVEWQKNWYCRIDLQASFLSLTGEGC